MERRTLPPVTLEDMERDGSIREDHPLMKKLKEARKRRPNPKKNRAARRRRIDWDSRDDLTFSRDGNRLLPGNPKHKVGYYSKCPGSTPKNPKKAPLHLAQIGGAKHKLGLIHEGKGKNGKSFSAAQIARLERSVL